MARVINLMVINGNVDWNRVTRLYGDLYHGRITRLYVALRPGDAGIEAQSRITRLLPNCVIRNIRETAAYRLIQCQYRTPGTPTPNNFPAPRAA